MYIYIYIYIGRDSWDSCFAGEFLCRDDPAVIIMLYLTFYNNMIIILDNNAIYYGPFIIEWYFKTVLISFHGIKIGLYSK